MPTKPPEHVLVVDDEEAIRRFCGRVLEGMGFSHATAANGEEALAALKARPADLVITDLSMPVMDGIRLCDEVHQRHPFTDVIVMTAYPRLETAIPLLKGGAYDYLIKPFDKDFLTSVVNRCLQKRRLSSDLDQEKVLRTELEAAYKELQKLEVMKDAFLSRINHELRTPLSPAMLALESLEKEVVSPAGRRMVKTLESNLIRMQEIVENLLVFAELRRETFTGYATEVDLGKLLEDIGARYKPLVEEKAVSVEVAVSPAARMVWGIPKLLETAFKHLYLNAVQFNKKGGSIRIKAEEVRGRIHVVFQDTGIGVPKEHLPRIFDSFYQVAEYLTREVGGLGLGLAIVRRVVEAHGGVIRADSDGETGTTFHVELPNRAPFVDKILDNIKNTSERFRDE